MLTKRFVAKRVYAFLISKRVRQWAKEDPEVICEYYCPNLDGFRYVDIVNLMKGLDPKDMKKFCRYCRSLSGMPSYIKECPCHYYGGFHQARKAGLKGAMKYLGIKDERRNRHLENNR